jgi:hypothetical protein
MGPGATYHATIETLAATFYRPDAETIGVQGTSTLAYDVSSHMCGLRRGVTVLIGYVNMGLLPE